MSPQGAIPGGIGGRWRSVLPRGGALPDDVCRWRHRGVLALLWLHLPAPFLFALPRGRSPLHGLLDVMPGRWVGSA